MLVQGPTKSFMSEAREGGELMRRRLASRRALSRPVSSTSRNRSVSLGTGAIGMASVASSTCEAVLRGERGSGGNRGGGRGRREEGKGE